MSILPPSSEEYEIEGALLGAILDATARLDSSREISACLKLAERLIEHAAFRSAAKDSQNVVEMMLLSDQAASLADKFAHR